MTNDPNESQIVESLVARASAGERAAQDELLSRYWELIAGVICVRRLREELEDMRQNIALHLVQELPKYTWKGRRAFIAWMKAVADSKVIDAQRHHMALKRDAAADTGIEKAENVAPRSGAGIETQVENQIRGEKVNAMLDQIKPEYATAVRMHVMGFTHPEIADVLGVPSEEAARKLVARGLSQLQKLGFGG
jgi:RNA polymerase sigma factor (sigma-70 family)